MEITILLQGIPRIGSPILGILIPAVLLVLSFLVTWLLYKKFSK